MNSSFQEEAIRFYCGLGEKRYNYHTVVTGPYACVSPVSGSTHKKVNQVAVPADTLLLQDSGAFNDACLYLRDGNRQMSTIHHTRLTHTEALLRQERHSEAFGYAHAIEARASYDVLIDETWVEDPSGSVTRIKKRWGETEAALAVDETVAAAAYLHHHRNGVPCIMSAQGVTPQQYLVCVQRILPYLRERDIVGLGGWCILGRIRSLFPAFQRTMQLVIPFLKREGIQRVHIWGVCFSEALGELLWLCDHDEDGNLDTTHRITLSTDSIGPSTRLVRRDLSTGYAVWGYASWRNGAYPVPPVLESCKMLDCTGEKSPTCMPETRCRGLERGRHILLTQEWLANFRTREPRFYHAPCYQLSWLEVSA